MNVYANKFSLEKQEEIKSFFAAKNAIFEDFQHALFRAKTKDFAAIFYKSGKFMIQGSDVTQIAKEFEQYLDAKQLCLNIPKKTAQSEHSYCEYIGTDESGKGDYFGPLVIAGVLIDEKNKELFLSLGVKDSKKLTDSSIKKMAVQIKNNSVHSIVVINPSKYNELYEKFKNLNKLLAWGHARVIENILEKNPCEYALSDKFGDESLIKNSLMKNGRQIKLEQKHKAESDIAVAAASIIARAEFVKKIEEQGHKYGIEFPKGASEKVITKAKEFAAKYSKENLKDVAKTHFKTTNLV